MKIAITSDWHLGCGITQTQKILPFLQKPCFDCLIINGDLVHSSFLIDSAGYDVLLALRNLNTQKIWVRGNHDTYVESLSKIIGAAFIDDEYIFESGRETFVVKHGHQFDKKINAKNTVSGAIISWITAHSLPRVSRWLMQTFPLGRGCSVKIGAIAHANGRNIIIGHTHKMVNDLKNKYWNTGSCVNLDCWYAMVDYGVVSMRKM